MAAASLSLLCVAAVVSRARGFNLDTRMPIVKRSDNPGSYFGYSVAGHQSTDEHNATRVVATWILVGAPLDKNLQPNTSRSGALWKCPLTSYYYDCVQVVTDGQRNSKGEHNSFECYYAIGSINLSPPMGNEIKEGQWLGVTVRSQGRGRKVMVCAHRFINRDNIDNWGQGLCYTLTQNLDFAECWEPCRGLENGSDNKQFGFCQAGTSGVLLEDDTIIMGSPGSYKSKGNLFLVSVADDYLHRDKTPYHSPVRDSERSPVESFSYLGMATVAGYFSDNKTMVYVAGAPRANGTGQVLLFTKRKNNEILSLLRANKHVISGEQLGSNFGYELATADLNGDKKPDLIVGAPFFFTEHTGGAVYIYINDENNCLNCKLPIKLVGKPESRFGFAITNLGDLNKDGYEDIAIGAPYEGNGVVYVYQGSSTGIDIIALQIIKAEHLVLNNLEIRTFGYSLSGNGMDLDQNGYPDLISGAYDSDMAILLRARPIVNLTITVDEDKIKNINSTNASCSVNGNTMLTCFTFQTCCSLESVVKAGSSRIKLRYKLEAETFQEGRKFSRVWFGPDLTTKSHIIENITTADYNKKQTCQTHTAYIRENIVDFLSPIAVRISYSLEQNNIPILKPGDDVPPLNDFPVLNQRQATKTFNVTFHKDCRNVECESQVHVNANFALPRKKDYEYNLVMGKYVEILLNMTASNTGESAYESRMFIFHPTSFNYIGTLKLENTKQIDCNPFNKTTVVCTLGNPFKKYASSNIQLRFEPKVLNDYENQVKFMVTSNSTSHEIDPQSPIILHINLIKQAELSLKGIARPEQVLYDVEVKNNASVKYRDEIGSRILHTYEIFNSGPWKVSYLEVHIEWPYQMIYPNLSVSSSENWLLYLDENPSVDAINGGECIVPLGEVNPLGLSISSKVQGMSLNSIHSYGSALKNIMTPKSTTNVIKNSTDTHENQFHRDQNDDIGPETFINDNGNNSKVVNVDCLLRNAKCFEIRCLINEIPSNRGASITIKSRLWNTTLTKFFPKMDSVRIASRAKIHIPSELSLIQNNISDDDFVVETIAKVKFSLLQEGKPISWWIYLLAINVGLFLLILLTLLLKKLGFFVRLRPNPTIECSDSFEKLTLDSLDDHSD